VKFFIDECISPRSTNLLADAGHDAVHVVERGLAGAVDDDVLDTARKESRVLVSADTDFGEILARRGSSLPSLILFRQGNRGAEHQVSTLLDNLPTIADELEAGAIVVFTDANIRIRRLPVR